MPRRDAQGLVAVVRSILSGDSYADHAVGVGLFGVELRDTTLKMRRARSRRST